MKVAIAGANSGIGRHIIGAILQKNKYEVIALSRHPSPELEALGATVAIVDYSSVDSIASALSKVHTIISAVGSADGSLATSELALIRAAERVSAKRFIPSGWASTYGGPDDYIEVYRPKAVAYEALEKSGLEWSFPMTGVFLNYFATPKAGVGHLRPGKYWVDIENCKATIPGDGNYKTVWTSADDVGEFVARALEVDNWPKEMHICGPSITFNEIVKIGERIRGKPFEVAYETEEELVKVIDPNPPSIWTNIVALFSLSQIRGRLTFGPNEFNDRVPMRFTSTEEFIQKWWGDDKAM